MKEIKDVRKQLVFAPSQVDAIEDWRSLQRPVPSWSEAARRLISKGLEAEAEIAES